MSICFKKEKGIGINLEKKKKLVRDSLTDSPNLAENSALVEPGIL